MTEIVAQANNQEVVAQPAEQTAAQPGPGAEANPVSPGRRGPVYRPAVDVYETADEIAIVAATPGASPEGIEVSFEDGTLTLHARVAERAAPGGRQLLREYGVGDYHRTFQVSERIDAAGITAEYRDGLVYLRLPKAEAAKPRKIAVKAAN
ncbi:MAG TPA: Hsp20/alpha crystallin family protein [Pirellulales bacterium]